VPWCMLKMTNAKGSAPMVQITRLQHTHPFTLDKQNRLQERVRLEVHLVGEILLASLQIQNSTAVSTK
jgi:hypothetical protein